MSSAICFNLNQCKILLSGNGLIATFQLSSAASLNLGWSQNGVLGNRLTEVIFYIAFNTEQEMERFELQYILGHNG